MVGEDWGITYVVDPGFFVWPDAPATTIVALHAAGLAAWLVLLLGAAWYRRYFRDSSLVDIGVAWFGVAAFGNLLDRSPSEARGTGR